MATVREKYISLQEGKISSKQFMEFVRKDPSLQGIVSPLQSFKDTVRVLSDRRIIKEDLSNKVDKAFRSAMAEIKNKNIDDSQEIEDVCGKWSEFYDLDPADYESLSQRINNEVSGNEGSDYQYGSNDVDEAFDNIPRDQYDAFTAEITDILKYKGLDDEDIEEIFTHYPKLIKGGFDIGDTPHDVIKTVLSLSQGYNDSMEDMNNARTDLNEYEDEYKRDKQEVDILSVLNEAFDYLKLDKENLNPNSFASGWKYEYLQQKTKDIDKAKETAEKNLVKNPLHYINLLAGVKDKKKRTDLPVEVDKKMSNTTDKLNATKIDTPNAKASAAKVNKETQKIPKYKEDTFKAQRAKGIKGVMDMPGKEKKVKLSELQYIAKTIASVIKEIVIQPKGSEDIKYYSEANKIKNGISSQYPDAKIFIRKIDYAKVASVLYDNENMEIDLSLSGRGGDYTFSIGRFHEGGMVHDDILDDKGANGVMLDNETISGLIQFVNQTPPDHILNMNN